MKSCGVRSGVRSPVPSIPDMKDLLEDARRRAAARLEGFPNLPGSGSFCVGYRPSYLQRAIIVSSVSAALTYEFGDSGELPSRPLPGGGRYRAPCPNRVGRVRALRRRRLIHKSA